MIITESEVYRKIQKIVAEALGVEEEEVTPEARLTDDLGAESIDYLDIAFRMEKAFGIEIRANEMLMGDFLTGQYVQDGKVTDAGIEELRKRLPHVNLDVLERSRDVGDFRSVFTVDALVRFAEAKLGGCESQKPEQIPRHGAADED